MELQIKLKQIIQQIFPQKFPKKIAIAVSGGIDSMALALLLNKLLAPKTEIIGLIVDHKLRKNSAQDAKITQKTLKNQQISSEILSYKTEVPQKNIEANLREIRYNLLNKFCVENNIKYLFVAHHEQDLAENFLIRLFRGSGIDGLSALEFISEVQDVKIIRPFLNFQKEELKNYLIQNKIKWVEDESNDDEKYLRNKIRKFLNSFEEKDLINKRIVSASKTILESRKIIEEKLIKNAKNILKFSEFGYFLLKKNEFKNLNEEEAKRYLAWVLMEVSGNFYKPRLQFLENLYFAILKNSEFKKRCFYGCVIENFDENNLIIYREKSKISSEILEDNMIWDNRFKINFENISAEIKIENIEASEFNKLEINYKKFAIPKNIFYTLPVFKKSNKILAIPHLNYFLDENLKKIQIKFDKKTKLK